MPNRCYLCMKKDNFTSTNTLHDLHFVSFKHSKSASCDLTEDCMIILFSAPLFPIID